MTQAAREPPYRRHDPQSTGPGFGRFAPGQLVKLRPGVTAPPQNLRPLWAETSDSLSRKLGIALVRGPAPMLRLRVSGAQADLSPLDIEELNLLLVELYNDIAPDAEDGPALSAAQ